MINLTEIIIFSDAPAISSQVHAAISRVLVALSERYGCEPARVNWNGPHGFQFVFGLRNIASSVRFDVDFVLACYKYSQMTSRNEFVNDFFKLMKNYGSKLSPSRSAINSVKQGLKMLLVELHAMRAIVLPAKFETGTHFKPASELNEILLFVNSFKVDGNGRQVNESSISDGEARRIYYYMPRILRATNWERVEDVDIFDYAQMHSAQWASAKKNDGNFNRSISVPWTLFLNLLIKNFPNRTSFSKKNLVDYSAWSLGSKAMDEISFYSYLKFKEEKRKNIVKTREGREMIPTWKREIESKGKKALSLSSKESMLFSLGGSLQHDDAISYFKSFVATMGERKIFECPDRIPNYVGREHVNLSNFALNWLEVICQYREYRLQKKEYESNSQDGSLSILCDYLFLYLPWWKEIYPISGIDLPRYPKDFKRFIFVTRDEASDLGKFPAGLLELVRLRRKGTTTEYSAIVDIHLFFDFVKEYYADDEIVAGTKFRNPILRKFDLPRVDKPGKTKKIVFPRQSYRYLVKYVYAVEALGEFLQERCLSGEMSPTSAFLLKRTSMLDAEHLGFIPFVRIDGKVIPIRSVPNVFFWAARSFKLNEKTRDVYVPHLTTHRALTCAIESGLRMASIIWLDRRTWNSRNSKFHLSGHFGLPSEGFPYVYTLIVNTDKTQNSFETEIMYRCHALLLREQYFQEKINEPGVNVSVQYMGRDITRFPSIVPLFRSANSHNPITEDYRRIWILLLSGFQDFFQSSTGNSTKFVEEVANRKGNGEIDKKLRAVNTPHACRATFATIRDGILDVEEIAYCLGHTSTATTRYYQSPRAEDLKEKLERADRFLIEDWKFFDGNSKSYIHSDKEDSPLVKSFRKDQHEAMKQFAFMPPITAWNISDSSMSVDKIEQLRSGPMSLMRFLPTHICPVGLQCPIEVIKSTGSTKRCGLCPLAMKCVDHLTAIGALKNSLVEKIQFDRKRAEELRLINEIQSADELYSEIEADTNELLAWQFSEEVLFKLLKERQASLDAIDDVVYLADQPEMVRNHLTRVVKNSTPLEFILERIADANAYPTMQSPELRFIAARLRKQILAGKEINDFFSNVGEFSAIADVAGLLKSVMRAHGLTLENVCKYILSPNMLMEGKSMFIEGQNV